MLNLYAEHIQLVGQGEFDYWTTVAARELLVCRQIIKGMQKWI